MTDIVEKLRAAGVVTIAEWDAIRSDAAREIERLREALDVARTTLLNIEHRSEEGRAVLSRILDDWQKIETAPKDGTRILARRLRCVDRYTGQLRYITHKTFWVKTSHVPIYGWNYGRDVENLNLWQPTHWKPIANHS